MRKEVRGKFYKNLNPPHPPIVHWVTEKTVFKKKSQSGPLKLKLEIVIECPKFTDGDLGFRRLMTTITVGEYHVRLPTRSLLIIMKWLKDNHDAITNAVEEVHRLNDTRNICLNQEPPHERQARKKRYRIKKVDFEKDLPKRKSSKKRTGRKGPRKPDSNMKNRGQLFRESDNNVVVQKR